MHSRKTILCAFVTILLTYSFALGCDCLTLNPEESFNQAESVFIGETTSIEGDGIQQKVTFDVIRSLKGESKTDISLYQERSNCSFHFVPGRVYLVFADRSNNGKLEASTCSSTRLYNSNGYCGNTGSETRLRYFQSLRSVVPFSYDEIALITAISVSLSLSTGFVVTRLWRKRKQN